MFDFRRPVSLRSSRFSVESDFVFVDFAADFFFVVVFLADAFLVVLALLDVFFVEVAFFVLGIVLMTILVRGNQSRELDGQHVRCVDEKKYTLR